MSVIGHTHISVVSGSQAPATGSATNASSSSGHELHVAIAPTAARAPSSMTTPVTPGHGHGAKIAIPYVDARRPTANDSPVTPGHGHGARYVSSSPVQPRPSARVARRNSLFATGGGSLEEGGDQEDATPGHPLFDVAHNGTLPPHSETEEPHSAEVDGRFNQPAHGQGGSSQEEDPSRPFGSA